MAPNSKELCERAKDIAKDIAKRHEELARVHKAAIRCAEDMANLLDQHAAPCPYWCGVEEMKKDEKPEITDPNMANQEDVKKCYSAWDIGYDRHEGKKQVLLKRRFFGRICTSKQLQEFKFIEIAQPLIITFASCPLEMFGHMIGLLPKLGRSIHDTSRTTTQGLAGFADQNSRDHDEIPLAFLHETRKRSYQG